MDTKELISRCQNGDQTAFGLLIDKYSDKLYAVAFRILNREEDAADAVQDTYISVWGNIEKYNLEIDFGWFDRFF